MKKSTKVKVWGISTGIVLALLLVLGFYLSSPVLISTSGDASSSTKIYECNWLCSIFHPNTEQAYFITGGGTTQFFVGDTITIQEELIFTNANCLLKGPLISVFQQVIINGVNKDLPYMLSNYPYGRVCDGQDHLLRQTTTYVFPSTGTYSIQTIAVRVLSGFANPSVVPNQGKTLTVIAKPTGCTKVPYYSSWVSTTPVANGDIQTRWYYIVNSDCTGFIKNNPETKIVCDSGFSLTNGNCISEAPTEAPTCEDSGNVGTYPNCQTPYICWDGSKVVSSSSCPAQVIDTANDITGEDTTNDIIIPADETSDTSDNNIDNKETPKLETWQVVTAWIIASLIVIGLVVLIVVLIRRR